MKTGKKITKLIFNVFFLVFCIVVAYYLSNYMFTSIPIEGDSMEHTIHNDDTSIVYKLGKYKVGDVVIFDAEIPNNTDKRLIKRIIGMPNDRIEIRKDTDDRYYVYRNGNKLVEDYTNPTNPLNGEMEEIVVPEGKFFFLGDNRGVSYDSRMGVLGDLDTIVGRVVLRYNAKDKKYDLTVVKRG